MWRFILVTLTLGLTACSGGDPTETPSPTPEGTVPPGCSAGADEVLRIHYQNAQVAGVYDQLYMWTWNAWPTEKDIPTCGQDSFGAVFDIPRSVFEEEGVADGTYMGFKFKMNAGTGGPWYEFDRSWTKGEDPWEVWVVFNDADTYASPTDALLPKITAAWLDSTTQVNVELSDAVAELADLDHWSLDQGSEIVAVDVTSTTTATLTVTPIDITLTHILTFHAPEGNITAALYPRKVMDDYVTDAPLGARVEGGNTTFSLWTPRATEVILYLAPGAEDAPTDIVPLTRGEKGVWSTTRSGNLDGWYYWYTVDGPEGPGEHFDKTKIINDPYAFVALSSYGGTAGRGMVVDLDAHLPLQDPYPIDRRPLQDLITYEAHIRDLMGNTNSGVGINDTDHRFKYLGWTLPDTHGPESVSTGISHIAQMGVGAVQILPVFEFPSDPNFFNWGYFTANFFSPEGMYATSEEGHARVTELRDLVLALHQKDVAVILDVVFNHSAEGTELGPTFNFKGLDSKYFYRQNPRSYVYSNGSGVGNELATENPMVRRFIVDACRFWVERYHVDGFRFDLLALLDVDTVAAISDTLVTQLGHENLYLYGEPWAASGALWAKGALNDLDHWAVFNDSYRDIVKGSPEGTGPGFIGGSGNAAGLLSAITGNTVSFDPTAVAWADTPLDSLAYMTSHDNLTLADKMEVSNLDLTDEQKQAMSRLAAVINFTSLGPVLFQGGDEFLRSKPYIDCDECDGRPTKDADEDKYYDANSYRSSDETNNFDWDLKARYIDLVGYWQTLITLRNGPVGEAFKLTTAPDEAYLTWAKDAANPLGVAYMLNADLSHGDHRVAVFLNSHDTTDATLTLTLPTGNGTWRLIADGTQISAEGFEPATGGDITLTLGPISHRVYADGF